MKNRYMFCRNLFQIISNGLTFSYIWELLVNPDDTSSTIKTEFSVRYKLDEKDTDNKLYQYFFDISDYQVSKFKRKCISLQKKCELLTILENYGDMCSTVIFNCLWLCSPVSTMVFFGISYSFLFNKQKLSIKYITSCFFILLNMSKSLFEHTVLTKIMLLLFRCYKIVI